MKKETILQRLTLVVSALLLVLGLLNATFGTWYGRGNFGNFEFEKNITGEELQNIYDKENWHSLLLFSIFCN